MLFDLVVTYLTYLACVVVAGWAIYAAARLSFRLGTYRRLAKHHLKIGLAVAVSFVCTFAACCEVGDRHFPLGEEWSGGWLFATLTVALLLAHLCFWLGMRRTQEKLEQEKREKAASDAGWLDSRCIF